MKDLKDTIITEGKIKAKDIQNYVKSFVTNSLTFDEYKEVLNAVLKGIDMGIQENLKYYKDDYKGGKPKIDTEAFDEVLTDIILYADRELYSKKFKMN